MALPDDELAALRASADAVRGAVEAWHGLAGEDPASW
jgi:hypothetical protein